MIKIVSVEHIRRIEAAADASGLTYAAMMQNAGRAAARRALAVLDGLPDVRVTVLIGKGNNGGDGLVAARVMAEESAALIRCYLLGNRDDDPLLQEARAAGVHIASAGDDQGFRVLRQMIGSAHLIVDALFGIGIRLPLHGDAARLLQVVQNAIDDNRAFRPEARLVRPADPAYHTSLPRFPYVLAIDCPSGLDCDSGEADANTLPADETITFIAAKPGLFTFPGASAVGDLTVATIGVPDDLPELQAATMTLADAEFAHDRLPDRSPASHKGTFGKALIVAGSINYRGALALSTGAAYRVGAGLVTGCAAEEVIASLAGHVAEVTWLLRPDSEDQIPSDYDALLIGPGWGRAEANRILLDRVLQRELPPLVIDADGLNLLADQPDWWTMLPASTILTPHPGEMSRLSGLSTAAIQSDRQAIAVEKAAQWGVILLLKGAHTLIAAPDGRVIVLPFKTDALAKAGTGDVLAGVIVGLLAQGLDPFDAAAVGSYLHGLAGTLAAADLGTTRSVVAGDVVAQLAQAIMRVERRSMVET